MNYRMIGHVLGMVLLCLTGLLLLPLVTGIIYGEDIRNFVICIAICAVPGLALAGIKPRSKDLYARSFPASLACLSNIGPGIGINGPYGNYSMFSDLSKMVLSFVMPLGRLEIYPILLLLLPSTWKH